MYNKCSDLDGKIQPLNSTTYLLEFLHSYCPILFSISISKNCDQI